MKGSISRFEVDARALRGNPLGDPHVRPLWIYLPPGYDPGQDRYPAIYFLHAFTNSGLSWTSHSAFALSAPERMDRLISEGNAPPAIGVFPDAWTALGGCQWDDSEALGNYRTYLVEDVVGWVDSHLRTVPRPAARAVVGKSSGGYGTLVMGRHHPDVFGHLACHSGDSYFEYCYLPDFPRAASAFARAGGVEAWFEGFRKRTAETQIRGDDHTPLNVLAMAAAYSPDPKSPLGCALPFALDTGRILEPVWRRWLAKDPVRFIPEAPAPFRKLSSVFIDCGTRDEANLLWGTRQVVAALREAGVEVVHEEFEDGHRGLLYRYERSLGHLLPRLERA